MLITQFRLIHQSRDQLGKGLRVVSRSFLLDLVSCGWRARAVKLRGGVHEPLQRSLFPTFSKQLQKKHSKTRGGKLLQVIAVQWVSFSKVRAIDQVQTKEFNNKAGTESSIPACYDSRRLTFVHDPLGKCYRGRQIQGLAHNVLTFCIFARAAGLLQEPGGFLCSSVASFRCHHQS